MVELQTIGLEKKMIDLHIHTCASDGTDDTRSLLERLRQAGIKTFAVSDHDTVDGISSIEPLVPEDMMFIRGIEFGCITEVRNSLHYEMTMLDSYVCMLEFDMNQRFYRYCDEYYDRQRAKVMDHLHVMVFIPFR